MTATVGRVVSIHRYPVKSMAGESLVSAELGPGGIRGDRAYALMDAETGRVVSAKRPRKWAGILDYEATFEEEPLSAGAPPHVSIRLPDGTQCTSADRPALDLALSGALGCSVRLESAAPGGATFEYHWPDMEGLEYKGRTYRDEITAHEVLPGTFFDGSELHLLTTAALDHLRALAPAGDFAARRFRPNLVIETVAGSTGFVENEWVGRTLQIGEEARVRIPGPCFRCVMVTLPQADRPKDPGVLRAAFDHNEGNVGVKAAAEAAGLVRVGDAVRLL